MHSSNNFAPLLETTFAFESECCSAKIVSQFHQLLQNLEVLRKARHICILGQHGPARITLTPPIELVTQTQLIGHMCL